MRGVGRGHQNVEGIHRLYLHGIQGRLVRKESMERLEHLALWVNNPEGGK